MIGLAKYLTRDEFELTVCSLRTSGIEVTGPILDKLGVRYFVSCFRPREKRLKDFRNSVNDQLVGDQFGPFDIQHSLDYSYSPYEAVMARAKGRLFISTLKQTVLVNRLHGLVLKSRSALAHRVSPISISAERVLLSLRVQPSKIRMVYVGIDVKEAEEKSVNWAGQSDEQYVLCVSHVIRRKRQLDAVIAFSGVAKQFPELRLKLAGDLKTDPGYVAEIKRKVEELGLQDRVDFLGVRSDVLQLMGDAEALLFCTEREAFGWVVVESMVAMTPVIASDIEGPGEIIEDRKSGLLVPVGDTDGFACALQEVLLNPESSAEMAKNARHRVETMFSAQAMVDGYTEMYRELMESRKSVRLA